MLVTDPPEHSMYIQLQVRTALLFMAAPHCVELDRQAEHMLALQAWFEEFQVLRMAAAWLSRDMSVAARIEARRASIGPWSCIGDEIYVKYEVSH